MTQEELSLLLERLDPDPETAGSRYEALRANLTALFRFWNCPFPEELSDETFDRVARKLQEGHRIESLRSYLRGVANRVRYESYRQRDKEQKARDSGNLPSPGSMPSNDNRESNVRLHCLTGCLEQLESPEKQLILRYYVGERRAKIEERRQLAAGNGWNLNQLRIRAYRIRRRLQTCTTKCVEISDNGRPTP